MTTKMRTALLGGAAVVLVAAAGYMLWPRQSGGVVAGPGKWAREIQICREVIFDAELYAREPLNFLEDTVWHQEISKDRVNFGGVVLMRNPQGITARHNYECDTYLGDLVNSFVRPQNSGGARVPTNRNLR
jgi:hypothetical protein